MSVTLKSTKARNHFLKTFEIEICIEQTCCNPGEFAFEGVSVPPSFFHAPFPLMCHQRFQFRFPYTGAKNLNFLKKSERAVFLYFCRCPPNHTEVEQTFFFFFSNLPLNLSKAFNLVFREAATVFFCFHPGFICL